MRIIQRNFYSFSLIFGQFYPHNFHSTFDDFIYFLSIGYKHCDTIVIITSKNGLLGPDLGNSLGSKALYKLTV